MRKCPRVGERVRFVGNLVVGPCTGVVEKIYQTVAYDEAQLDAAQELDEDREYYAALRRAERGLKPESEWHVSLKVDVKPEKWCYGDYDKFAPEVKELARATN